MQGRCIDLFWSHNLQMVCNNLFILKKLRNILSIHEQPFYWNLYEWNIFLFDIHDDADISFFQLISKSSYEAYPAQSQIQKSCRQIIAGSSPCNSILMASVTQTESYHYHCKSATAAERKSARLSIGSIWILRTWNDWKGYEGDCFVDTVLSQYRLLKWF